MERRPIRLRAGVRREPPARHGRRGPLLGVRLIAPGRLLGRPKGSRGRSKLDGKEGEIRMLLEKQVSQASIAKIMGISSTNLRHFIRT